MLQTLVRPDSPAIRQYHQMLQEAKNQEAQYEGNARNAFDRLLRDTAKFKGWELVTEVTEQRDQGRVRYDGVLRDAYRLPHAWWEAKDKSDDLDSEIRKKRNRGYRFDNIIFENTQEAVLIQDGEEVFRRDLYSPKEVAE